MKKFLISTLAVLLLVVSLLSGCALDKDPWTYKKEENGFYYCYENEEGKVVRSKINAKSSVIIGLTYEKKITKELVIPEKLGGRKVTGIGKSHCVFITAEWKYYGIEANNIEKIVINNHLQISYVNDFKGDYIVNDIVHLYGTEFRVVVNIDTIPTEICPQYVEQDNTATVFNATGGELKTYFIVAHQGRLLPKPEDPTKEGYAFAGWYTDETCNNEWNFETDTVKEDITLYAKWEII